MVKNYNNMLSCFHTIPERYGQTDRRRTDRFAISISLVSLLTRDKKCKASLAKEFTVRKDVAY